MKAALLLLLLVASAATAAITNRQFRHAECIVLCGKDSSARIRRRCMFDPTACGNGPPCSTTTTTTTTLCPCSTTTTLAWNWTLGRDGTDPADTDTRDW